MHHSGRGKSSTFATFALSLALLAACRPAPERQDTNQAAPPPAAKPAAIPVPQRALDREALLVAAMRAASAAATGIDDRGLQDELRGRRFEFRWRFACDDNVLGGSMRADLGKDEETLRVTVEPTLAADSPLVAPWLEQGFEAASGFIVDQPWLLTPACAAPAAGEGTLAIAELFTAEGSRASRPPQKFEITRKIDGGALPEGGFDFVLSGRMEPLPDGKVIHCLAADPGTRPQCLISVKVDRAAVENPADGQVLGDWGGR